MRISKEQQSVIAIAAGLFVMAWIRNSTPFLVMGITAGIAVFIPIIYRPLHWFWMQLSGILGWISSHVILSILFYIFLTPLSLIRRLAGRQDLKFFRKEKNSVFYNRNHVYDPKDFLNPW